MAITIRPGVPVALAIAGAFFGVTRAALAVQPAMGEVGRNFLASRQAFWELCVALEYPRRNECLRYQARRKGRPGWRSIRIPRRPA